MLFHLVKSKVADEGNEVGNLLINLEMIKEIHLRKYIEKGKPDVYHIIFEYSNRSDYSREAHDTIESAKQSLEIVLAKTGMEASDISNIIRTMDFPEINIKEEENKRELSIAKLLSRSLDS